MADYIHGNRYKSIYERTDYITNTDTAINEALLTSWRYGIVTEISRHPGFAPNNRLPQASIIAQSAPMLAYKKGRG